MISGDSTASSSTKSTARSRLQVEISMKVEDKKMEETDMMKLCAEIIEKTSKWQNFNVQLAVDQYNRREQKIKVLEEENSLLVVEIYHLLMELKGKEKH